MKNVTYKVAILGLLPIILVMSTVLVSHLRATPASHSDAIVASIGQSAMISAMPGRADAENTFIVGGISATGLRLLSRSLDMNMGITSYVAKPVGAGRWQVTNIEVPMVGRWGIEVQAWRQQTWVTVGDIAYDVPFTGQMRLVRST
jgi:hypothetical protein